MIKFNIKILYMQEKTNKKSPHFINILGQIVKKHREKSRKNVYLISAEASVPRSTWRDLEFGISNDIKLSTFCKIAEGLDIPPNELLKELLENLGSDFSFTDLK